MFDALFASFVIDRHLMKLDCRHVKKLFEKNVGSYPAQNILSHYQLESNKLNMYCFKESVWVNK